MEMQLSNRLSQLPPYPFAKLRARIAEKKAQGVKVISLGIGDPDQPTPDLVIDELCRAVQDPDDANRHRYGCDVPVEHLTKAVIDFYKRRYGVTLTPEMVCITQGSKDAIVKLCMGILNPGDIGIAPCPGYPTYNIGHVWASAVTHRVTLRKEKGFLLDPEELPAEVRRLGKLLWINYPNNPTTALADTAYFKQMVEFGQANDILIAHDSAYSENTYEGYKAPSILEVDGAAETAVEFFSLSKAFNMTGWRVGCLVGNPSAVKALKLVKDNVDNGCLRAIQSAAALALDKAEAIFPAVNEVYRKRRDMVVEALGKAGWPVEAPKATIYIWAPVPEKFKGDSGAFAEELLEKAGVVVTPGRAFGAGGEGYYRISLTYPDAVLEEALGRIIDLGR